VPNVVGKDHQLAQDTMQAAGLYNLAEEDASGQGRMLIIDRTWTGVSQSPSAGRLVADDQTLTRRSKKDGEYSRRYGHLRRRALGRRRADAQCRVRLGGPSRHRGGASQRRRDHPRAVAHLLRRVRGGFRDLTATYGRSRTIRGSDWHTTAV
jgi:hypothetical protein